MRSPTLFLVALSLLARPAEGAPALPAVTALLPASVPAGSAAFTLTVNGSTFKNTSVVRWNGTDRLTTYVSATQLKASILASDVATAGTPSVTVFNSGGGGGTSAARTFTINNLVPMLGTSTPKQSCAGDSAFTLTVNGSNYSSTSVVRWNGANRATTYVSGTQLNALIPAEDVASAGTASVTVWTPAPGGGTSNAVTYTVNPAASPPYVSGIAPQTLTSGSSAFTLTVNGSGFKTTSVVRWKGLDRQTTFMNSFQLTAAIPATDVASAGTAGVTAFSPCAGASNTATLVIVAPNPLPTVTSLTPSGVTPASTTFTLTVNGSNFVPGSTVRWNGLARPTTFVFPVRLTTQIYASDVVNAGTASVTVFNPSPGGGYSNPPLSFDIRNPLPPPLLTMMSIGGCRAGSPSFELTVNGSNFGANSVVRWNGSDRTTTFVSNSLLRARIPAGDVGSAGTANVTVFTAAPGGGTSNALPFVINAL